jgi:hypothetical protein
MATQNTLMKFDPATGESRPYPSHAAQWREYHGLGTAWLFNPWTGARRDARDVGSDMLGRAIVPPDTPMYAAQQYMQPPSVLIREANATLGANILAGIGQPFQPN